MSVSNQYEVKFNLKGNVQSAINFALQETSADNDYVMVEFCDEAQLPNVQAATAQMTGRFLGEGPYQYPHTRLFTDVSLGFLCDANLTQLKFFQNWYHTDSNST